MRSPNIVRSVRPYTVRPYGEMGMPGVLYGARSAPMYGERVCKVILLSFWSFVEF